jgi:membrane dipeptidase
MDWGWVPAVVKAGSSEGQGGGEGSMKAEFKTADVSVEVRTLHDDALVVDAHHDILLHVQNRRQAGEHGVLASFWAPQLRAGGVDVQIFPVYLQSDFLPELALRQMLRCIEAFWADLEEDPGPFQPARSYAEIEAAVAGVKIAAVLALEGLEGLGNDLELLSLCYRLGVRVASLTWNRRTAFADGAGETETGGGLTSLGRAAIKEMNRLGMVVDVAHLSERGFWDVLKIAERTVIASHTNARALCDHPRNLWDEQIRAIAENGGVMGLLIHPAVIDPAAPTVARIVDHVAHVADLVGIEYVGLGIDLVSWILSPADARGGQALMSQEMLASMLPGMEQVGQLPNITAEMKRRGFADDEIRLFLGGNLMRVFREILN